MSELKREDVERLLELEDAEGWSSGDESDYVHLLKSLKVVDLCREILAMDERIRQSEQIATDYRETLKVRSDQLKQAELKGRKAVIEDVVLAASFLPLSPHSAERVLLDTIRQHDFFIRALPPEPSEKRSL